MVLTTSFDAAVGEVVALAGPGGADTTTLFRGLTGWPEPDVGRVLVADRD